MCLHSCQRCFLKSHELSKRSVYSRIFLAVKCEATCKGSTIQATYVLSGLPEFRTLASNIVSLRCVTRSNGLEDDPNISLIMLCEFVGALLVVAYRKGSIICRRMKTQLVDMFSSVPSPLEVDISFHIISIAILSRALKQPRVYDQKYQGRSRVITMTMMEHTNINHQASARSMDQGTKPDQTH